MRGAIFLCLLLAATTRLSAEPIEATTKDGKRVLLKDDGTWEFVTLESLGLTVTATWDAVVRKKPDILGEVLGRFPEGTSFTVVDHVRGYWIVRAGGIEGFLSETHAMDGNDMNRPAYEKAGLTAPKAPPADQREQRIEERVREVEATIDSHCRREWPEDFAMRRYCVSQQREGYLQLAKGKPPDIGAREFEIVRRKCGQEWPKDYSMWAYCEKQQYDAILGR